MTARTDTATAPRPVHADRSRRATGRSGLRTALPAALVVTACLWIAATAVTGMGHFFG